MIMISGKPEVTVELYSGSYCMASVGFFIPHKNRKTNVSIKWYRSHIKVKVEQSVLKTLHIAGPGFIWFSQLNG